MKIILNNHLVYLKETHENYAKPKLPSCFHLLDHLLIALQDFPKDHMFHVQVRRLLGSFSVCYVSILKMG